MIDDPSGNIQFVNFNPPNFLLFLQHLLRVLTKIGVVRIKLTDQTEHRWVVFTRFYQVCQSATKVIDSTRDCAISLFIPSYLGCADTCICLKDWRTIFVQPSKSVRRTTHNLP